MKVSVVPTVNGEDIHGTEQESAPPTSMSPSVSPQRPSLSLPEPPVQSTVPPSNYPTPGQTLNTQAVQGTGGFHVILLMQWQQIPYSELSVLVAWLRALASIHQSHHWQSSADPFYGDHLMFERLYDQTNKTIDKVAEKAVGMGCSDLVEPGKLVKHAAAIVEAMYIARPGIPQPTDLAVRSLYIEKEFIKAIDVMSDSLESKGLLSKGVDNMLAEMADEAEGRVYLLKQRLAL